MRILHHIPNLAGGGAERQLALVASAQARAGHDVHVALLDGGVHLSQVESSGVTVHRLPPSGHYDPRLVVRLTRLIKWAHPDVNHTWLTLMDVAAGAASMLARSPWVMSELSVAAAYTDGYKYRVRETFGRLADAVIANSSAGRAYWVQKGAREDRCVVVPNPVDLDAIDASPAPSVRDVDPNHPLVLFVGRLAPEKNLDTILDTFALVLPQRNAKAMICGDGPERDSVARGIAERRLSEHVVIAGYRTDVWSLLRAAKLTVCLSRFEGRPNVVLEAMAARCPLVVSDIPAHHELLTADQALFVPTDDPAAAATAMASILDDPGSAAERSISARRAVEAFRAEKIVGEMAAVYNRVIRR